MAKKRIISRPGLFGYIYHYDENGKCIGKSRPSLIGNGQVHYDTNGKQVGTSRQGFFAKEVYHDEENEQYISSYESIIGDVYYESGASLGVSRPGFGGTEYITLDVESEAEEAHFDEDDFPEDDDLQEFSAFEGGNQKNIITNIITFIVCFFIVGILILVFK